MTDPITITNNSGIKCDNTECDYTDNTVTYEDLKNWINKPCPKCNSNLLTQKDYDLVVELHNLIDEINNNPALQELANITPKEEFVTVKTKLNGSGSLDFELV